ncbi:hypothetical protein [Mesorhizobium sp. CAU 1741]|uniref:hypothetical protein n=1 Tax=Mesorhizobium sp. CAU 1741 TaxID=3140366 RepID=UPI00325B7F3C
MLETMRDRGKFWTPAPGLSARIERNDFSAGFVTGLQQVLISGDLDKAAAAIAPSAREVGLWGLAEGTQTWVRFARDRALLVSTASLEIAPGWRDGYVATPCDDGYAVIDLSGPALPEVVAEATSADLEAGSPSAAILFAGVTALLYRSNPRTARLHVESPLAAYLWRWLEERK